MPFAFRIILFGCGLLLLILVIELVRRNRLREELSISWFFISFGLLISAVADLIIDPLAFKLGINYPPALVFACLALLLILASLYFSVVISDLKGKIKELTQKIALMEYKINKKDNKSSK
jgi:tellurite resistance protein TehA-like permease